MADLVEATMAKLEIKTRYPFSAFRSFCKNEKSETWRRLFLFLIDDGRSPVPSWMETHFNDGIRFYYVLTRFHWVKPSKTSYPVKGFT